MDIILKQTVILASSSPRRRELLRSLGLKFKTVPAHIDEDYLEGETLRQHVVRLARNKAGLVAEKYPDAWVLGADTIVVVDGQILGKPENKTQAKKMLQKLNGRTHKVYTCFVIARRNSRVSKTRVIQSTVRFKNISPDEMKWYISTKEPYDKAGGYAAQEKGASFIKALRGSYTNVIGLPLCEVLEELKKLGVIRFR
ncbi:MAG TPA: septum formation inhibitor Maf [Deltaproteobacteria bacterium]|nr:septum formation inhibitor Maf [Deltaproteobacteria bacterium]